MRGHLTYFRRRRWAYEIVWRAVVSGTRTDRSTDGKIPLPQPPPNPRNCRRPPDTEWRARTILTRVRTPAEY